MKSKEDVSAYVTRKDILATFRRDVPRYILPQDVRNKFAVDFKNYVESLTADSLRQRRIQLRHQLDLLFTNVLTDNFEPPLSAYLREQKTELTCFYIDRVNEVELQLTKSLRVASATVPTPVSWKQFWLKLFTEKI